MLHRTTSSLQYAALESLDIAENHPRGYGEALYGDPSHYAGRQNGCNFAYPAKQSIWKRSIKQPNSAIKRSQLFFNFRGMFDAVDMKLVFSIDLTLTLARKSPSPL
jgi:hypothetical protein